MSFLSINKLRILNRCCIQFYNRKYAKYLHCAGAMPGQVGEAKLKKRKFRRFCILDTWNIITLAFFGKTGWYYYWGNNTLLKAKTTDWLGLNRLIATVWNYSRLSLYFPLSVFKVPHATNGSILLSSSLSGSC